MKISAVDIFRYDVPFSHVMHTRLGSLDAAHNIAICINSDTGLEGWGEASPFQPITGDSQSSNFEAAQHFATTLCGRDPRSLRIRMAEFDAVVRGEPSIRAAFDTALYDLCAKAAGCPLFQFLGGESRALRTDATVSMYESEDALVERVRELVSFGFESLKIKVGRPGIIDVMHLSAVRAAVGPEVQLRADANQGWDLQSASRNLRAIEQLNLIYVEQPLAAWDWRNLSRLRDASAVPICADESVCNDKDAFRILSDNGADYLSIKLGKVGGISAASKIDAIAASAGSKCVLGCSAESRLGLTAAAHFAAAQPNVEFLDLDSAYLLQADPVNGGAEFRLEAGGRILLSDEPGHGASLTEAFRAHGVRVRA